MKITFNITMYHGTNTKCIDIFERVGFLKTSNSCAVQDINDAIGFGDKVISFKYPFKIHISDLFWFMQEYYNKGLIVCVSGFKPKKVNYGSSDKNI